MSNQQTMPVEDPLTAVKKALRVIESCTTVDQLRVAARLARRVIRAYSHRPGWWACSITLDDRLRRKAFEIGPGQRLLADFLRVIGDLT